MSVDERRKNWKEEWSYQWRRNKRLQFHAQHIENLVWYCLFSILNRGADHVSPVGSRT